MKYQATGFVKISVTVKVEADSEEEARQKADDASMQTLDDIERLMAVFEAARRVRWAAHALQQAEESPRSRPFDGGAWQAAVQGAQRGLDEAIDAIAAAVDAAEKTT